MVGRTNIGGSGGIFSDEVTVKQSDIPKGLTAVTSDSDDEVVTGTLELTGNASKENVLASKTFYNTDIYTKETGTMTDYSEINNNIGGYSSNYSTTPIHKGRAMGVSATTVSGETLVSIIPPKGYFNNSARVGVLQSDAASVIGLTAAKLAKGQKVLGVTGTNCGLGNATSAHVLSNATFSSSSLSNAKGTIASLAGSTITPNASKQTVACAGKYMTSNITISAVANLAAANIANGKVVGGVTGTYKGLGNATAAQVLNGKYFSTASLSNTKGTMADYSAKNSTSNYAGGTFRSGATNYVFASPSATGYYTTSSYIRVPATNLAAANIKKGVKILGITGTYEGYYSGNGVVYNRGVWGSGYSTSWAVPQGGTTSNKIESNTSITFSTKGCDFGSASKSIVTNAYSNLKITISTDYDVYPVTFLFYMYNVSGSEILLKTMSTPNKSVEYTLTVDLSAINTNVYWFMTTRYNNGDYYFPGFTLYSIILS